MADFQANVGVNFDASNALAAIKQLQSQIADLNRTLSQGSAVNSAAAKNFQRNLVADINASGKFVARMQQIQSTTEQFTTALERNKLSMGQYFRYAASTTKTFGNKFTTEFKTIEKVARERVKALQTQYVALGRDANGALQSIAIRPLKLDLDSLATKQAIAAQKQQIFNQLLKQGSTNLLNFGKNTQWAGRQLMVGFTIPLSIFGTQASKTFMSLEEQAIKFKRVYGELFTPPGEADEMLASLKELGTELTKYGVALEDTLALAGDVAAMGKTGSDLLAQVEQATRLAVLGNVDQQKALEASISITNAFGIAAEDLGAKINFLNAVENQTVLSIEDLTTAIPKAGPVVQQLGGSVEDLAFFMTAMKEGGINASEGANALKSGLASIINPTDKANEMLKALGINVGQIVESNKGDLKGTIVEFAEALNELDPLERARAIEELFGKFQFARISTLFQNITTEGTQATRVLDLTNSSLSDLAQLSEKELGNLSETTTYRFKKAMEQLQISIAPIGEQFLKAITPVVEFAANLLKRFDDMSDGAKNFVVILTTVLGGIAPIALMVFGLVANGVANLIKGFAAVRNIFVKTGQDSTILGSQIEYMTQEQLQAGAVAASLEQSHQRLTQQFTSEKAAIELLIDAYRRASVAGNSLVAVKPIPSTLGAAKGYASGGIISGPGTGTSDSILAMVSNGEAIIPADVVARNPKIIEQLVSGQIPGFSKGSSKVSAYGGSTTMLSGGGVPFALGNSASSKLGMSNSFFQSDDFTKMFSAGAVGGAFRANAAKGEMMSLDKLQQYMAEAGKDLQEIVAILRKAKESMEAAGEDIDSFDDITKKAKKDLQAKFDEMTARGGKSAQVAKTVQREMLDPTAESIASSSLSEKRARAVRFDPVTGVSKETVFRVNGTRGKDTATRAASLLYPDESARLAQAGGSYAHLNETRIGGSSIPVSGGLMGLPNSQAKTDALAKLQASSQKQAAAYPEGIKINRAEVKKNAVKAGQAFNEGFSSEAEDAYPLSRDRKSPHRLAEPDGRDDAKAYQSGFTSESKKQQGKSRRVQGKMVDGQLQISDPNATQSGGSRRSRRVTVDPGTPQGDAARVAAAEKQAADAAARKAAADADAAASSRKFSRAANGAMYALTTLSGVAAMAGGEFAEVASFIFQVSAGMTALNAVIGMFTEQTLASIAVQRFRDAQSTAGSFVAGQGIKGLGKNLLVAGRGLLAFIGGPVGLGILGATAAIGGLIAGIVIINQKREEERKKIEALTIAAEGARGKLSEIAQLMFGGDRQKSTRGQVGGDADVTQRKEELLSQEGALDQFSDFTDKLSNAADADIQGIVNSMVYTLQSEGYENIDIQALIQALLEKAEKADLEVNFDNVTIGQSERDIKNNVDSLVDKINSEFESQPRSVNLVAGYSTYTKQLSETEVASEVANSNMREMTELTSDVAVGLIGIADQLERNGISATTASNKATNLMNVFGKLPDALILESLPTLAEQIFGPDSDQAKLYEGLDNAQAGLKLIQAQALGLNIDPTLFKQVQSPDIKEAAVAQAKLNSLLNQFLIGKQNEKKLAEEGAIQEKAKADLSNLETEVELQKKKKEAYDNLVAGGLDAAEASEIVSSASLYEAYAAALAADELDKLNGMYDEKDNNVSRMLALVAELENFKLPDLGGSGQGSDPYKDAIDSLKSQNEELINSSKAYKLLRNAGYDISTSAKLAADSTLALALATTKPNTRKYKELLELIKEVDKASRNNAIKQLVADRSADIQIKSQFMDSFNILTSMGYAAEDIVSILDNPDLAKAFIGDLKDGKLDSQQLLNYLKQIDQFKKIEVQVALSTPEGKWSEVDKQLGNVRNWFSTQKEAIDIKFRPQIEAQEDVIKNAQDEIEDYNAKIYENEYQLEGVGRQEDSINEKYDARIKALDTIVKVNKVIEAQQKGAMSVADALSQGDIAAAARAAQESRVAVAAAQAEQRQEQLELAREKELANIRSNDGRTRVDIEKEIEDYKSKISKIEHDTVKPAEKIRDAAIATRDAEKDSLNFLGLNETAWGDLETAANLARVEAEAYKKAIEDAIALLPKLGMKTPEGYTGQGTDNSQSSTDKEIAELNRLILITRDRVQNDKYTDEAQKQRLIQMNIDRIKDVRKLGGVAASNGGLIPKYFASGGLALGTDTVPAMLTPGEFVMRKYAVDNFGIEKLKAINSGTYTGDSVYNYQVNVNVKSDANPDQIASAVMTKIKAVESQRLRGGRI